MTENPLDMAPASRRQFLALGAVAGAAVLVLPKLPALAQSNGDVRALRFLESLELFQANFFTKAALSSSSDTLAPNVSFVLNTIAKQDQEQASWFRMAQKLYSVDEHPSNSTLSTPRLAPEFNISVKSFATPQALLDSAIAIKSAAIEAFQGQIESADKPEIVQALAQLAGVQNRHLALLNEAAKKDPLTALVTGATASRSSERLAKYGFTEEIAK